MNLIWIQTNQPFSWHQIDLDSDEEGYCFRDIVDLKPGMLLDCECQDEKGEKTRQYVLVGHINPSTGVCGCCRISSIVFVFRYTVIDLPSHGA